MNTSASPTRPSPDEHAPPNKGSDFAEDDVVSDDEELLHLAIALNASTTDATKTADSVPKARYNRNGLINGMPTDSRPSSSALADGVHANVHTRFLDDEGDDGDKSEDSDSDGEHSSRDHLTASPATKRKRRTQRVILSKGVWMHAEHKDVSPPKRRKRHVSRSSDVERNAAVTVLPARKSDGEGPQRSTEPPLLRPTRSPQRAGMLSTPRTPTAQHPTTPPRRLPTAPLPMTAQDER